METVSCVLRYANTYPSFNEDSSPHKANPAYKGKWYAPMIDNPLYKGEWAPRKIPNPSFFEDLTPVKSLSKIVRFPTCIVFACKIYFSRAALVSSSGQ